MFTQRAQRCGPLCVMLYALSLARALALAVTERKLHQIQLSFVLTTQRTTSKPELVFYLIFFSQTNKCCALLHRDDIDDIRTHTKTTEHASSLQPTSAHCHRIVCHALGYSMLHAYCVVDTMHSRLMCLNCTPSMHNVRTWNAKNVCTLARCVNG